MELAMTKISLEKYDDLSDLMLRMCRNLDDLLYPKGGWNGWTTGGMRVMTDGILQQLLKELGVEIDDQ